MTIVHDLSIGINSASIITEALKSLNFQTRLKEITGGVHMEVTPPANIPEHDARARVRAAIIQATKIKQ